MSQAMLLSAVLADLIDYQGFDPLIHALCADSRQVTPGCLFFAHKGLQRDRRLFITDAIQQGASAVLYEAEDLTPQIQTLIHRYAEQIPLIPIARLDQKIGFFAANFYQHPCQSMHLTGITGTNGKTSCAYFITQALELLGKNAVMMGTIGNGKIHALQESTHTTMEPLALQQQLYDFSKQQVHYVTLEVSSHALDQYRVTATPFEIALFTNLTLDHLDYHQSMQAYGEAKAKLFQWQSLKYAVINLDDAFSNALLEKIANSVKVIGVSLEQKNHERCDILIRADQLEFNNAHSVATIHIQAKDQELFSSAFKTKLLGKFNINNLLLVLGALQGLGIDWPQALPILAQLTEAPGRLSKLSAHGIDVFVDYSHTPDALEKALTVLKPLCQGQLWCIFGCGGDRDNSKRPVMAAIAEKYADQVIVTDDNPRTENPAHIVAQIMQGFKTPEKITLQHDRAKAIQETIAKAQAHDFVLVAGKGHENYQIIGEHKFALSDFEIAKHALAAK